MNENVRAINDVVDNVTTRERKICHSKKDSHEYSVEKFRKSIVNFKI